MQDAFAHCAALVRAADHDRFIAALFAPAETRPALHALYAFNAEVARVRDVAHAALPGEIRLQWWSEVLSGQRIEEARANPVASALLASIERYHLPTQKLIDLIEARRFDLYDEPMATVADLEAYAAKTSSILLSTAARITAGIDGATVAGPAGAASAIASLLQAFPIHIARHQLYVPMDILERHEVRINDLYAGRPSAGVSAALAELRSLARHHLAEAGELIKTLPRDVVPALLPVALVRPVLDRLERGDPFAPIEIPRWRRQWLIWRAARNPARIAG